MEADRFNMNLMDKGDRRIAKTLHFDEYNFFRFPAEFNNERGVPQGDPLSPFLFVIAMEAFSNMASRAASLGIISSIELPYHGPKISHLLYADDAIILGSWSRTCPTKLTRLLRCFQPVSGLKVNLEKSVFFGFNLSHTDLSFAADTLQCSLGSLPMSYLGLYVGSNMNQIKMWQPVIDTFHNRLSSWKAKTLSIGGRITLIKSVLVSLPSYYFSLYKAPDLIRGKVENGGTIRFWIDTWIGDTSLRQDLPDLYNLERSKNCLIKDRLQLHLGNLSWSWHWTAPPSSAIEISQLINLEAQIQHIKLSSLEDSWFWAPDPSGTFSVHSLSKLIQQASFGPSFWQFPWNKTAPIKANVLCWRIEQNRLPTSDQLSKRNIEIPCTVCPLCNKFEESAEHLFLRCEFARMLWSLLTNWCKFPLLPPDSFHQLFSSHKDPLLDPKKASRISLLTIAFCSVIWKYRNAKIFDNRPPYIHAAFKDLQTLGFQ